MATKSVLIFCYYFPPAAAAGVFRCLRFVRGLSRLGWRPLVVAVSPEATGDKTDASLLDQIPDNVVVRRTSISFPDDAMAAVLRRWRPSRTATAPRPSGNATPVAPRQRTGMARLAENMWDFAVATPDRGIWWQKPAIHAAQELVRQYQPQIMLSTTPPHSSQLIAAKFHRLSGLPWIMDLRDPWARGNWPRERNPWGQRMAGRLERRCVTAADQVVLNTPRALADFRKHYSDLSPEKFICIPNGYDPELMQVISGLQAQVRPAASGRFRLCHPGGLIGRRDPRCLIAAIGSLAERGIPIDLELVGNVAPQFHIAKELARLGLTDRVTLTGSVPHQVALERMAQADAFVVVQPDTAIQVPGKLYEMMMFRKPIVALTGDGATADLIRQYQLGAISLPDRTEDIARAIQAVVEGHAGATAAWDETLQAYHGDRLTEQLAGAMENCLAK